MAAMRKETVVAGLVLALVVLSAAPGGTLGDCDASQLAVCLLSITIGLPPTKGCCDTLKAQQPCLCEYAKDPNYGRYIKNPHARKTLHSCGIPVPTC